MPFPKRPSLLSFAAGALLLGAALAGCTEDYTGGPTEQSPTRHLQPLSATVYKELGEKGMSSADPILVRIYKDESKFEVWKRRAQDGRYAFFKSYVICRWSGTLGPKVKEGDRQAPEGFYSIFPGQMNPKSNYYLSFNIGYPNAYDKSFARTGTNLMVHGACSSAGCYSMTDANIAEIYSLARESMNAGQRSFQVQAYPFRMTAENMAKYRNNPNMSFWKNLKQGSDHFEVTRLEPKVGVCGKKYVFDTATDNALLSAAAPCPQLQETPEIATAVAAKTKADTAKVALLVAAGIEEAPLDVRQPDPAAKKVVPVLVASTARRDGPKGPDSPSQPATLVATAVAAKQTPATAEVRPIGVQVASLDGGVAAGPSVFERLLGVGKPAAAQEPSAAQAQAYTSPEQEKPFYEKVLDFSWLKGGGKEQPASQQPQPAAAGMSNPTIAAASSGLPAVANARTPRAGPIAAPTAQPVPQAPAAGRAPAAPAYPALASAEQEATATLPRRAIKPSLAVESLPAAPVAPVHSVAVPEIAPAPRLVPVAAPAPDAVASEAPAAAAPASPSRITGAFSAFN